MHTRNARLGRTCSYLQAVVDDLCDDIPVESIHIELAASSSGSLGTRQRVLWPGPGAAACPCHHSDTDPALLGYCLFFSDDKVSAFNASYEFFTRRVVRVLENPFVEKDGAVLGLVFNHVIPSMMDFIGRNHANSPAVKFTTGFQLGIVILLDRCLTLYGNEHLACQHHAEQASLTLCVGLNTAGTLKACRHQDVMNFLMSSYCLLGTCHGADVSLLGAYSTANTVAQSFQLDIAASAMGRHVNANALVSWFYLHDQIFRLMTKYFLLAESSQIETVLYILDYSGCLESLIPR